MIINTALLHREGFNSFSKPMIKSFQSILLTFSMLPILTRTFDPFLSHLYSLFLSLSLVPQFSSSSLSLFLHPSPLFLSSFSPIPFHTSISVLCAIPYFFLPLSPYSIFFYSYLNNLDVGDQISWNFVWIFPYLYFFYKIRHRIKYMMMWYS